MPYPLRNFSLSLPFYVGWWILFFIRRHIALMSFDMKLCLDLWKYGVLFLLFCIHPCTVREQISPKCFAWLRDSLYHPPTRFFCFGRRSNFMSAFFYCSLLTLCIFYCTSRCSRWATVCRSTSVLCKTNSSICPRPERQVQPAAVCVFEGEVVLRLKQQ